MCRTDLHLAEGDLQPRRLSTVPGHEIVGVVAATGEAAHRFAVGDRVGVPWLAGTDGTCRFCRRGNENLCTGPTFTGWDVDGGYADQCLAEEAFAYRIPDGIDDEQAAPLLCAGIIGYRALLRSGVEPGERLGIYGFGGSAHLTAQLALHLGMRVHVLTRGEANQQLARELQSTPSGRPTASRPNCSTARSCSRRPANWCRSPCGRWTAAGSWPSRGSGSVTFQPSPMPTNCSTSGSCAASPRTPGPTANGSSTSPSGSVSESTTTGYPMSEASRALADLKNGRFGGAAVLHNGE